ncbi:haloacid dehalogenase [Amycolatopsis sp. WAC 04182]|uniref:HAD family hydrolase n=1 Tax=Amycolatopsis sp. WAC 04182 TaxID=2203198 RepID=UPI000F7B2550|nr:HAD family hydrolase [Amycolatopsis sp. WAC 04182]RSN60605.1 haloacid dehalogenase [Amycolatopsis sp. WAC 04182]
MRINTVFFDVGEVLIDEAREYGTWADWLGVSRHTFSGVFGSIIAQGRDYRETFQVFRPGFDLAEEREKRAAAGQPEWFGEDDLYPDVRPCLARLRELGLTVGISGNQTARAEGLLRGLDLPHDILGTSDTWGVEKPSTNFFTRVVAEAGVSAEQILYVGDRLDNDVAPAQEVGMKTAVIRRGIWGHVLRDPESPIEKACVFTLDSLAELPNLVQAYNADEG